MHVWESVRVLCIYHSVNDIHSNRNVFCSIDLCIECLAAAIHILRCVFLYPKTQYAFNEYGHFRFICCRVALISFQFHSLQWDKRPVDKECENLVPFRLENSICNFSCCLFPTSIESFGVNVQLYLRWWGEVERDSNQYVYYVNICRVQRKLFYNQK